MKSNAIFLSILASIALLASGVGAMARPQQSTDETAPAPPPPGRAQATSTPARTSTFSDEGPTDAASLAILSRLETPVPMPFNEETSLSNVISYISSSTIEEQSFPNGLPIYIDPIGLQEAEQTMDSVVTLDLEGIALKRSLHLILRQLDLVYAVKDGLLIISSPDALDKLLLDEPIHQPSEKSKLKRLVERGEATDEEAQRLEVLMKPEREEEERFRRSRGGAFQ